MSAYYSANQIVDAVVDGLTVEETIDRIGSDWAILVAMGANPSASSTPKMGVVQQLLDKLPTARACGLHPQAMGGDRVITLPPVDDLCKLKPDWSNIDLHKYKAHNWHCLHNIDSRQGYGVMYTSFGCPFSCSYCNIHTLYNGITFREPQDVVDELGYFVSKGIKNIKFADEMFTVNKKHVNEVCDLIIEQGWDLNIWAYAKTGTVDKGLLEKMKRSGINWLAYGFESGNEDILGGVCKKQQDWEMFRDVEDTKESGISVLGNFIFGLPNDTLDTMTETLETAINLNCEWVNFYCAMAYPGSQLYDETLEEDLPHKWEDYDQFSPNLKPLRTDSLEPWQILEFRDYAFEKYFNREEYLNMIWRKFGIQAVEHIKEMLEWTPRPIRV